MKSKIICLLTSLCLLGCKSEKTKEENHNYHEIKSCLLNWSDVFNQSETDYLVYFYSERCGHCNEIKNEIISYYYSTDNKLYFVCTDIDSVIGPVKDLTGIDNIDDFYIFGTPFLIRIYEFMVKEYYAGTKAILNFIDNF